MTNALVAVCLNTLTMSIESYEQLVALREIGHICHLALCAMANFVRQGVTTRDVADVGAKVMRENGARSAPPLVYGFPGDICISLNDEAVHGIPGKREIQPGDLVKLDVTFEKNGYMADAAITVPVEPAAGEARRLALCAERAFHQAMRVAKAEHRVNEIGRAVEREVQRSGFSVIRALGGHGIGRTIHEPPIVPNYHDFAARERLTPGMVITVEPIIAMGEGRSFTSADGWTERTVDGSLAAHFEHTLVVTQEAPILLTAA
jgi:methionyl aminopeptidase